MKMRLHLWFWMVAVVSASTASAQPMILPGLLARGAAAVAGVAAGRVQLPYSTSDNAGNTWFIYNDGALRQQTGQPIYSQGGMLVVDGNPFNSPNNQGTLDAKTRELILENPQLNGIGVTRRIFFDKDAGLVRYVDIFHNPTNQPRAVNVNYQSVLNWGIEQNQLIPDPKHKEQNLAWAGLTGMGKVVMEVYGGVGGKLIPAIQNQPGGNVLGATCSLTIPPQKDLALVHLHLFLPSMDAAPKFIAGLNPTKLLANLRPEVRKAIVNFSAGDDWLPNIEILRGDALDVVELRGGDQLRGTLSETVYKLNTFHGTVELRADKIICVVNAGVWHPRQLLIASDGEIFGGQLAKPTIDIALSSGQVVPVPLDRISRVGYRKQPGEPDEITLDKPTVTMRGGDRLAILPPAQKIEVASRFGTLALDPATVGAIVFQTEETGVHEIDLNDGSKFAGLVASDSIEMSLAGVGPAQTVKFPVTSMLRLQLAPKLADVDTDTAVLQLVSHDSLCGSLDGVFKLQTSFDTISVDGRQVQRITRAAPGAGAASIQVMLWDGSTISGQIIEPTVTCLLGCGIALNVPSAQVSQYIQPHPLPSPGMVKDIQATAADLGADDWRQRDRAEAKLGSMGPAVIGVLKDIRPKLDAEAQQRIDSIIKKLQTPAVGSAGNPNGMNGNQ